MMQLRRPAGLQYESPRIGSASVHFLPDNSGGTCSVCGNGNYEEDIGACEECGQHEYSPKRVPAVVHPAGSEAAKHRRLAATIGQGNDSFCDQCTFPLRREDGIGREVCYYCLLRDTTPDKLVFCRMCGFFTPRGSTDGLACKWCREHGALRSMALSYGLAADRGYDERATDFVLLFAKGSGRKWDRTISMNEAKKAFAGDEQACRTTIERMIKEKLLTVMADSGYMLYAHGALQKAGEFRAEGGKKVEVKDRYSKIVSALDTPKWREWLIAFLERQTDDLEDDEEAENALEKVFEHYDVYYYDGASVFVDFVRFIVRNESERFGKDPELGKAIQDYRRRLPDSRFEGKA